MFVASFFTKDTPYEIEAENLKKSLERLNVRFVIEGLPAQKSWVESCALKASFVKSVRDRYDEDFWWLDADAELRRPLKTYSGNAPDLAAYMSDGYNFRSGAVYFSRSYTTTCIIDEWVEYCKSYPYVWDQVLLLFALHNNIVSRGARFEVLPEAYCKKDPKKKKRFLKRLVSEPLSFLERPIVLQHQASRRLKQVYDQPVRLDVRIEDIDAPTIEVIRTNSSELIDVEAVVTAAAQKKSNRQRSTA
ncbi:putative nucleotide-diphospho-sugar transferase [Roseibium sp. SCPC15]|uniref:putative nucleotide-diphospho-sugar transferase n=1 Tax=Roseibium sp. SCP15 TaxID=3141376 RepID=UPI003337D37E